MKTRYAVAIDHDGVDLWFTGKREIRSLKDDVKKAFKTTDRKAAEGWARLMTRELGEPGYRFRVVPVR